jgi:hypothetical protein
VGVGSFGGFSGPESGAVRLDSKEQSGNQSGGPDAGEYRLRKRETFLPFSGVSAARSSISRSTLFYEVVFLALVGVVFAFPAALGFLRLFDNANRKRKLSAAVMLCGGLCGTIFFYGWAATLHPLAIFGLR